MNRSTSRASLLAALASLTLATGALAQDLSGASATGYAWGSFDIGCTTCGHYAIELTGNPMPADGGPGALEAGFNYLGLPDRAASGIPDDYTLGGAVSMAAAAAIVGPLGSPLLGARAGADNESVFNVQQPQVPIGVDYYGASATAEVVQRYTFVGSTPITYVWTFALDGTIDDSRSSVGGYAGFYDDALEVNHAFGSAAHQGVGLNSPPTSFSDSFTLSMGFAPGESFYMRAWLTAQVTGEYASADTFADAMHTMQVVSITGGDTTLLVPGMAGPVPEPGPGALWLVGMAVLGFLRLRQRD
ncbi:MAG: hypothetical protein KA141_01045 [Rubrivivax sp.]|nr:hypothetical protein [Rubrivivax sp.]